MRGLKYLFGGFIGLLDGLGYIFGAKPTKQRQRRCDQWGYAIPKDRAKEELDKYTKQSDAERIASDLRAIGGDMHRAMKRLEEMAYGQR